MRFLTPLLASLLVTTTALAADPPGAATDTVCTPTFQLASGPNAAGTAFVLDSLRKGGPRWLVTAHHLFGPNGGLERQLAWDELPSAVSGVQCQALSILGWSVQAGRPSAVRGAHVSTEDGPVRDIAAFALPDTSVPGLKLALTEPKVDDVVWLVARVRAGAAPRVLLHRAQVVQAGANELAYAFDNRELGLAGTSGAPVVNEAGQLVAIHFGAGRQDGQLLGFGVTRRIITSSLGSLGSPR